MAIVHMKKLRLMVVRRQKDELLRDLMLLGCVQIAAACASALICLARFSASLIVVIASNDIRTPPYESNCYYAAQRPFSRTVST